MARFGFNAGAEQLTLVGAGSWPHRQSSTRECGNQDRGLTSSARRALQGLERGHAQYKRKPFFPCRGSLVEIRGRILLKRGGIMGTKIDLVLKFLCKFQMDFHDHRQVKMHNPSYFVFIPGHEYNHSESYNQLVTILSLRIIKPVDGWESDIGDARFADAIEAISKPLRSSDYYI
ncbi:uncharacterized protein LOC118343764 [Juglans regia]|uniref:Uncharacterized protein LOC118343764 n=1 Tax=Juglans regia TaxID=51240 RepID=A0A6P9DW03_JUGRE|nr:uncharacterized protein LOC118343764 [Juglans regia]